jgi:hypothetical protein
MDRMSRLLAALFVALALLLAPAGASAMAASASHHEMVGKNHCGDASDQPVKADKMSCCAAMCSAAAAVVPQPVVAPLMEAHATERPVPGRVLRSFLAELPTPPPRFA